MHLCQEQQIPQNDHVKLKGLFCCLYKCVLSLYIMLYSKKKNLVPFQGMYKGLIDNIQSHVDILSAKIDQLNVQQDQAVPNDDHSPSKGRVQILSLFYNTI